jgi:hypothetical protein
MGIWILGLWCLILGEILVVTCLGLIGDRIDNGILGCFAVDFLGVVSVVNDCGLMI